MPIVAAKKRVRTCDGHTALTPQACAAPGHHRALETGDDGTGEIAREIARSREAVREAAREIVHETAREIVTETVIIIGAKATIGTAHHVTAREGRVMTHRLQRPQLRPWGCLLQRWRRV
jgi:DNA-binding FrmR family transcriptional regulator